jgi:Cytochrome C oxidase, cbb3-type, subunit III
VLTRRFSSGAAKRVSHDLAGLLLTILVLLFFVVFVLPVASRSQQTVSSSGQMSFSRLGCANCHGADAHGAMGKPGGPDINKTPLRLRRFVGYVRLPVGMMPPHPPKWVPDADLAAVYSWLGGIDAVRTPPPIRVELSESPEGQGGAKPKSDIQIAIAVLPAALNPDVPDPASLRYRLTVITNRKAPVANQTLEYQSANADEWLKFTTDGNGEAFLNLEAPSTNARGNARAQLRMPTTAIRTAIVIEAIDPSNSVIVGVGSTVVAARR